MGYEYKDIRPRIFQEENQALFLEMRDKIRELCAKAGAVRVQEVMHGLAGDTWTMLAVFDRLVELHEIYEVTTHSDAAQLRVFVLIT